MIISISSLTKQFVRLKKQMQHKVTSLICINAVARLMANSNSSSINRLSLKMDMNSSFLMWCLKLIKYQCCSREIRMRQFARRRAVSWFSSLRSKLVSEHLQKQQVNFNDWSDPQIWKKLGKVDMWKRCYFNETVKCGVSVTTLWHFSTKKR